MLRNSDLLSFFNKKKSKVIVQIQLIITVESRVTPPIITSKLFKYKYRFRSSVLKMVQIEFMYFSWLKWKKIHACPLVWIIWLEMNNIYIYTIKHLPCTIYPTNCTDINVIQWIAFNRRRVQIDPSLFCSSPFVQR